MSQPPEHSQTLKWSKILPLVLALRDQVAHFVGDARGGGWVVVCEHGDHIAGAVQIDVQVAVDAVEAAAPAWTNPPRKRLLRLGAKEVQDTSAG